MDSSKTRDDFAAAALGGILACSKDYEGAEGKIGRIRMAFDYADAMMAERQRRYGDKKSAFVVIPNELEPKLFGKQSSQYVTGWNDCRSEIMRSLCNRDGDA